MRIVLNSLRSGMAFVFTAEINFSLEYQAGNINTL